MKPITTKRAERIARNINAMDLHYQYIDQFSKYKFWSDLKSKLIAILSTLTEADKNTIKQLCEEPNAKYFGLI